MNIRFSRFFLWSERNISYTCLLLEFTRWRKSWIREVLFYLDIKSWIWNRSKNVWPNEILITRYLIGNYFVTFQKWKKRLFRCFHDEKKLIWINDLREDSWYRNDFVFLKFKMISNFRRRRRIDSHSNWLIENFKKSVIVSSSENDESVVVCSLMLSWKDQS